MAFSKDVFLACVDTINDKNYDYGNEVLYRNCGFCCLPEPGAATIDTKFSSAIWLIGKSYSADPTRSAPKNAFSNKGLGSSFEQIAKNVYHSEDYPDLYERLKQLREKNYTYNNDADDQKTLLETVKLVDTLNEMVKGAMTKAAREKKLDETDSENVMSFCSKFLHFMCPRLFFIFDSFSFSGGSALFGRAMNKVLDATTNESSICVPIDKEAKSFFKTVFPLSSPPNGSLEEPIKSYHTHCLRAYSLACFLKKENKICKPQIDGDPNSGYMPRLTDAILMRITNETMQ